MTISSVPAAGHNSSRLVHGSRIVKSFVHDKCLTMTKSIRYVCSVSSESVVQYPIRAAANLTGLSIDTLRAWERRYQAVTPIRGERGRVYGEGHIRRLILLRDAVARGHAIGQVAGLEDSALEKLLVGPVPVAKAPEPDRTEHAVSDTLLPVVAAIESFDYATANFHLGRLAALLPVDRLVSEVVFPLMQLVGDRWHERHPDHRAGAHDVVDSAKPAGWAGSPQHILISVAADSVCHPIRGTARVRHPGGGACWPWPADLKLSTSGRVFRLLKLWPRPNEPRRGPSL